MYIVEKKPTPTTTAAQQDFHLHEKHGIDREKLGFGFWSKCVLS